ncbi:uncharacterized protein LOC141557959 isoform X4 [Sminthopsis crassicaudata]
MVPSPGPRPREHRLWLLGGPPLKTPTLWKQQLLGLAPPMTRPPSIHHHQLPSPENEKRDTISESVGRGAFSTTIYPQGMKRPRHQESQSITGKGEERHFYEKAAGPNVLRKNTFEEPLVSKGKLQNGAAFSLPLCCSSGFSATIR